MFDYATIRKIILTQINSYMSPVIAIMNDESNPKPTDANGNTIYPYIGCKVTSPFTTQSTLGTETWDNVASSNPNFEYDVKITRQEQPTITMSLNVYSQTLDEAETIALKLYAWFKFFGYDFFDSNNMVVVECSDISDRDTLLVTDYEKRKGFDAIIRVSSDISETVDTIENIEINQE